MPVACPAGALFQVTIEGTTEGQKTANVWHFRAKTASTDVDLHLILVFLNCFITNVLPVLAPTWEITGVRWKQIFPTLGNEFIHIPTGVRAGGSLSQAEPSFVSALLSMRTELGGREHRGRKYICGIPEDQTTGSLINVEPGALWAGLLAFAACVIAAFVQPADAVTADLFEVGVFSRKIGGSAFPVVATGFTPVVQITPSRELATTRSRKIGHGG